MLVQNIYVFKIQNYKLSGYKFWILVKATKELPHARQKLELK